MTKLGYALSSEEFTPAQLISYAQEAERSGFAFSLISDHFHPWINRQNNSPFVWPVLGALAQSTNKMHIRYGGDLSDSQNSSTGRGQAAATGGGNDAWALFTWAWQGEYLNEHNWQ